MVVDTKDATIVKDKVQTGSDGTYRFSDLDKGDYVVLFQYDTNTYRVTEYQKKYTGAEYLENTKDSTPKVYTIKADIVLPCATQNDINLETAKILVNNGVIAVGEGANMPTEIDAIHYLQQNKVLHAPAKAANAGGVATSALEMSQNSMRYSWTFEEVDEKLDRRMTNIFKTCKDTADKYGLGTDYLSGANIAAFNKVADAMIAQGII